MATSSIPLISRSLLIPGPHCFNYCRFVESFKVGKCESSNCVLLFQNYFGSSGFLQVPYECENMLFHFWGKKAPGIVDGYCV